MKPNKKNVTYFNSSLIKMYSSFRILIVILFLFSLGLTYAQQDVTVLAERFTTKDFDVAIFPETSPEIFPGKSKFTPTKQEVEKAEATLRLRLKEINSEKHNQYDTPVIDKNLRKYKRQYFGYIDDKGERILFINCFWRNDKEESQLWLRERVRVLDGGSYFWNIKFKIDKNELYDLDVNGNG